MSAENLIKDASQWAAPLETLAGRRLCLLVTGGIAAYKAAELARLWVRAGAKVRVIMTEAATRFITPLTFEALTAQPVVVDMWARGQTEVEHIAWADWAEAVMVAPASADFLAKMAHGLADDFASAFMLACARPKMAAVAMNSNMYAAAATQDNLRLLKSRGVEIIDPAEGLLACGTVGAGRLAEIENIALCGARALAPKDLAGRKIIVSAGATREAWDDIRYMTNRSSGLMGLSLALVAWLRGASVTLVAGPSLAAAPALPDFSTVKIESTVDLLAALQKVVPDNEALVMAAAPADFRPAERVRGKIKKDGGPPELKLAANPDILKALAPLKGERLFIGFAAEADDILEKAKGKLAAKKLDLIVANRAEAAFASPNNHLWILNPQGEAREISSRPKFAAAWAVWDAAFELR